VFFCTDPHLLVA